MILHIYRSEVGHWLCSRCELLTLWPQTGKFLASTIILTSCSKGTSYCRLLRATPEYKCL